MSVICSLDMFVGQNNPIVLEPFMGEGGGGIPNLVFGALMSNLGENSPFSKKILR